MASLEDSVADDVQESKPLLQSPGSENEKHGCAKCIWKEEIKDLHELNKGDHICYKGKTLVMHHAIVTDIEEISPCGKTAWVTVIEYTKRRNIFRINERKKQRNLDGKSIWRVRYHHPIYPPDVIIKRAHKRLNETKYNVLTNNCEHFCNYCCVGNITSLQVNKCCHIPSRVWYFTFDMLSYVALLPLKFYMIYKNKTFNDTPISGGILLLILLIYTLLFVLRRYRYSFFVHKCEGLCFNRPICLERKLVGKLFDICDICHGYKSKIRLITVIAMWIFQCGTFALIYWKNSLDDIFALDEKDLYKKRFLSMEIELGCCIFTALIAGCVPRVVGICYPHPRKGKPIRDRNGDA